MTVANGFPNTMCGASSLQLKVWEKYSHVSDASGDCIIPFSNSFGSVSITVYIYHCSLLYCQTKKTMRFLIIAQTAFIEKAFHNFLYLTPLSIFLSYLGNEGE